MLILALLKIELKLLTFSVVSNPSNGTLSSINGNLLTYTPDENWFGTDTFVYQANDGVSNSNTAVISILVKAVNDAPTIDDFQGNVDEDNTNEVLRCSYHVESEKTADGGFGEYEFDPVGDDNNYNCWDPVTP